LLHHFRSGVGGGEGARDRKDSHKKLRNSPAKDIRRLNKLLSNRIWKLSEDDLLSFILLLFF
jgi:hypothetical protein